MLKRTILLLLIIQTTALGKILYNAQFDQPVYDWDAYGGTIEQQQQTGMESPALVVHPEDNYCKAYAEFPVVDLKPGDELELRFRALAAEHAPENWGGFRFGLYERKNDTGYYASLGTGSSGNFDLYFANDEDYLFVSDMGGKLKDGGSGIGGFSEHTILHFTLRVTMSGESSGSIAVIVSDDARSGSVFYKSCTPLLSRFGRIVFGTGQVKMPFWIDDVQVEVHRQTVSVQASNAKTLPKTYADITPTPERMNQIEKMLNTKQRIGLGEPIGNRTVWNRLALTDGGKEAIRTAEGYLYDTWKPRDSRLFDKQSQMDRSKLTGYHTDRFIRLGALALAECLEDQGRFLPKLNEMLSGLASEGTWTVPWVKHPYPWEADPQPIELDSAKLGADIANTIYWLHDRLDPEVVSSVDAALKRNLLDPLRTMLKTGTPVYSFEWYMEPSNWNAVCLYGVLSAALAVPLEPEERAFYLAFTERSIRYFLSTFEPDGFYPEGINYWSFGFSRFLVVHELCRRATNGKIDLLAQPHARLVGSYPILAEVAGQRVAGYSDDIPGSDNINKGALSFFLRRCGEPFDANCLGLDTFSQNQYLYIPALFAHPLSPADTIKHPLVTKKGSKRQIMKSGQLYIFRPGNSQTAFSAYTKFGHNGTPHNHNDIGTYGIAFADGSMPVWDLGKMVYNNQTFGGDRYDLEIHTSIAHSVPLVNGKQQGTGEIFHARIVEEGMTDTTDRVTADLTDAYACSSLKQLLRTVEYSRDGPGSFTVTDTVTFTQPARFETAIASFGRVNIISENQLRFSDGGQTVIATIESDHLFHITEKRIPQQLANGKQGHRFGIALKEPCTTAHIAIRFTPE